MLHAPRLLRRALAAALAAGVVAPLAPLSTLAPVAAQTPDEPGLTIEELGDEIPPGAADGYVMGDEPPPVDEQAVTTSATVSPAAVTTRYFGRGPYQDIQSAVAAAVRPSGCAVSDRGLKALVLAPIFYESSGATTTATAPSPMTLSRYDEWNPNANQQTSNAGANYSLYESRNTSTPYPRAYWHPGIGIWQYDSAGLGAPFTAVQRMDTSFMAPRVTARILDRYCTSITAGDDGATARRKAWADWAGCTGGGCETLWRELYDNDFSQLRLVDSIDRLGGAEMRTCSLPGTGSFPCAHVDPAKAQGARWWATLTPNDGNPRVAPAPLSLPFYVFELDGREHRHWLVEDTGYNADISASRQLGKNARYRTDQAGSGLTWSRSSTLCDETTLRGSCGLAPAAGMSSATFAINGTYQPFVGDFDGDGLDDIFWYAPGPAGDSIWFANGDATFRTASVAVNGEFRDVTTADVDGDGRDDIIWYDAGRAAGSVWLSNGDGSFRAHAITPGDGAQLLVLRRGVKDTLLWYRPGAGADSLWRWTGSAFDVTATPISGSYVPLVGDFDADGADDVLWYGPGAASDTIWYATGPAAGFTTVRTSVGGTYRPQVGDFDGNGADDVLWYGPGAVADSVWFGAGSRTFTTQKITVNGTYDPLVVALGTSARDTVLWQGSGTSLDPWWSWSAGRALSTSNVRTPSTHEPVVGRFTSSAGEAVLWYQAGPSADVLWYR